MNDAECVSFLQWALPRLGMRWAGFRRVRRQVRRRVNARLHRLGLADAVAYRGFLETHAEEWAVLDALCRVTVSRFYRNRGVFDFLAETVLPALADRALQRGATALRVWSAGCASGEEPYTLALLWSHRRPAGAHGLGLEVVATDADEHMLRRAREAVYPRSSVRELPQVWRSQGFERTEGGDYRLRGAAERGVTFCQQDVREAMPEAPFDLVLCRNLVFTYFEEGLQRRLLAGMADRVVGAGGLVLGHHEVLPEGVEGWEPWGVPGPVYRRIRGC